MTTPVMVAAVFTVVPYTLVVRYSFPAFGVLLGTLTGYAVVVPLSVAAYYLIGRMAKGRGSPGDVVSETGIEPVL